MNKLIKLIENAYCWEGGARAKQLPQTSPDKVEFNVDGRSTVEHSGDVSGIYGQVGELRGQSVTENGKTYKILDATCKIREGSRSEDDDYEVYVSGKVTVSVVSC